MSCLDSARSGRLPPGRIGVQPYRGVENPIRDVQADESEWISSPSFPVSYRCANVHLFDLVTYIFPHACQKDGTFLGAFSRAPSRFHAPWRLISFRPCLRTPTTVLRADPRCVRVRCGVRRVRSSARCSLPCKHLCTRRTCLFRRRHERCCLQERRWARLLRLLVRIWWPPWARPLVAPPSSA